MHEVTQGGRDPFTSGKCVLREADARGPRRSLTSRRSRPAKLKLLEKVA